MNWFTCGSTYHVGYTWHSVEYTQPNRAAVLRQLKVSVTCSVVDGRVCWWLTRESGKPPVCTDSTSCGCDRTELSPAELRKAYVVVKLSARWWWSRPRWSEVLIGQMCRETLFLVEHRIAPIMAGLQSSPVVGVNSTCEWHVRKWFCDAQLLTSVIDRGAFSTGLVCECSVQHACSVCTVAPITEHRFEEQYRFDGVFPYGQEFWWTGITCAVGSVRDDVLWLSCPAFRNANSGC